MLFDTARQTRECKYRLQTGIKEGGYSLAQQDSLLKQDLEYADGTNSRQTEDICQDFK